MAKAAPAAAKPPAKATKKRATPKPPAQPADAAKAPSKASNWRVAATTADEVAQKIDQALQGKLANVAAHKAKKSAGINKDVKKPAQKSAKGTSKRVASTKKAAPIVKSPVKTPAKPPRKHAAQPPGRPSLFTQAIADEICERLSKGEPLAEICRSDNMPAVRTVSDWKQANPDFSANFARVREEGFDAIAAACMKIADDGSNDTYVDADGMVKTDYDIVQRSKLRIETRLKLLAKWDPKRYGDKVDVNHGGQEGNPIDVRTKVVMVPPKQVADVLSRPLMAEDN